MDGLLDFLQTPGGMGLLSAAAAYAAGAQRGTPINNIGRGLLGGVQGYISAADNQLKREKGKLELSMLNAYIGRNPQAQDARKYGSDPSSGASTGAPIGGVSAPLNGAQSVSAPMKAGDPRILGGLAMLGGKYGDAWGIQKDIMTGLRRDTGYYFDPVSGSWSYMADPSKGVTIDPKTKQVTELPGFSAASANIKRAEKRAEEEEKARLNVLPREMWGEGKNGLVPDTQLGLASRINGVANQANQTSQPAGAVPTIQGNGKTFVKPYDDDRVGKITAAVSRPHPYDAMFVEYGKKYGIDPMELKLRAVAESGLNPIAVSPAGALGVGQFMPGTAKQLGITNPTDPRQSIDGMARLLSSYKQKAGGHMPMVDMMYYGGENSDAWGRDTQQYAANLNAARNRLGGGVNIDPQQTQQAQPQEQTLRYPSQAELAGAKAQAEADVEVKKQGALKTQEIARAAEQRYGQIAASISEARKLLPTATGSGFGTAIDKAAGMFGKTPDGAIEANQLKTLSGWLTSNVPRMEGPQSDRDTMMYREMAAMVGDSTIPVKQRMAALDTLEKLQEKYRHLNVPAEMQRTANNSGASGRQMTQQEQAELQALRRRFGRI